MPRRTLTIFDPLNDRIDPCLAKLAPAPPTGENWAFEVKWDGYRIACHRDLNEVRILTRNGIDWTDRFPAIVGALTQLPDVKSIVLDGEAVVLDQLGRSDFNALQTALGRRGKKIAGDQVILYAFDLLYLNGLDLTARPLGERRRLLEGLLRGELGTIRLSEEVDADGPAFLEVACQMELEGIIAKRLDRPYRSGRTGDWLKIKCVASETFLIAGYEPSKTAPREIASLLLAARSGDQLSYVGSVGTGFSAKIAASLKHKLDRLAVRTPAIPIKNPRAIFVSPELAATIEFRGWTSDSKLRHAAFKVLRDPADRDEIHSIKDLKQRSE